MALPLELYRPIIEQVESRNDLYNLLFVSRFFCLEVEPVLYHTLTFKHLEHCSDIYRLSSFLGQIPCDRVALHVRNLTITEFPPGQDLLEQHLRQMCNLRNLSLMSTHHWVLSFTGCNFQLHTLFMRGVMTIDIAFLETQKELTELDIPTIRNPCFSSEAFPKMLILSAAFRGSKQFVNNRPLRALRFIGFAPDGVRQQSVRSLRLPYREPPEDFSARLEGFPSLRYLYIDVIYEVVWDDFVQTLFPLLSHLNYLVKLHVRMSAVLSPETRDATVEHIFAFLKNLQELVIEYDTHSTQTGQMEWIRGGKTYIHCPRNENEWKDSRWS